MIDESRVGIILGTCGFVFVSAMYCFVLLLIVGDGGPPRMHRALFFWVVLGREGVAK